MIKIHAIITSFVTINPDEYELVVIDAANVVHSTILDSDSNETPAIFPERLEAAIEYCQEIGWDVQAFLKHGTYLWAVKNHSLSNIGDVSIFDRLIKLNVLELVNKEKEDIFWIDYAMKNSGLIITHDKFRQERIDFPDRDWGAIGESTLRDYDILDNGDFILPSLPIKGEGSRTTYKGLKARIGELEIRVSTLESALNEQIETEISEVDEEPVKLEVDAIVTEVFNRLLGSGEKRHMTPILQTLGSVLLGLDVSNLKNWPEDWRDQLNQILGVKGKMSKWVQDLSPRELEFSDNRSTIWYA